MASDETPRRRAAVPPIVAWVVVVAMACGGAGGAHGFVALQLVPSGSRLSSSLSPRPAPAASGRHLRAPLCALAMAKGKKKDKGAVKSGGSAAAVPARSAVAIIADVRAALAESGNGFDASAQVIAAAATLPRRGRVLLRCAVSVTHCAR
jgi:hypothetical protein